MHRDALRGPARRQLHELSDALCMRPSGRVRLPSTAVGGEGVRVKVSAPGLVVLLNIVPALADGDALGKSGLAARDRTAPPCVLLREVGELVGVEVVELSDVAQEAAAHAPMALLTVQLPANG
eukprot:130450-Alexandrium_andersonii.AAC.1